MMNEALLSLHCWHNYMSSRCKSKKVKLNHLIHMNILSGNLLGVSILLERISEVD